MGSRSVTPLVVVLGLATVVGGEREALAREAPARARAAPALLPPPPWRIFATRTTRIVTQLPRAPRPFTIRLPRPATFADVCGRRPGRCEPSPRSGRGACSTSACIWPSGRRSSRSRGATTRGFLDAVAGQIPYVGFSLGTFELVKDLSKGDRESLLQAWCL
jgi:hypothetical protein